MRTQRDKRSVGVVCAGSSFLFLKKGQRVVGVAELLIQRRRFAFESRTLDGRQVRPFLGRSRHFFFSFTETKDTRRLILIG